MSCSEGYPAKPCPLGAMSEDQRCTRKSCGGCRFYNPPIHILQWCMLWDREHFLCMKPKSDCETCPEKSPKSPEVLGAIDWKDPKAVRAYLLKLNPTRERDKMVRFVEKNPSYFKDYQEKHREEVNANARRWYQKNKERQRAKAQPGSGKVPGDPQ